MSAVESRYSVDVVTVGETSVRVEVLSMRERRDRPGIDRLIGMRIAAPHAAVATRLGPTGLRRLIAALEQAGVDAFGPRGGAHDDAIDDDDNDNAGDAQ